MHSYARRTPVQCPYVTLDLMLTLQQMPRTEGGRYEFRTAAGSAEVAHPGVAGAGTYYVFEKSAAGCYSDAAAVTITINECLAPVPICACFPGSVSVKAESSAGLLRLMAEIGGSASRGAWITSGSFSAADSLRTTYTPSVSDYAREMVTLTFQTDDPDPKASRPMATASMTASCWAMSPTG